MWLKKTIRWIILLLSSLVFVFALLSGTNEEVSIWENLPNAWPWLTLLFLNYLLWKKELLGGVALTFFGLFAVWFFNFSGGVFFLSTFLMTSMLLMLGLIFSYLAWRDSL
jgi:hypothetical protein